MLCGLAQARRLELGWSYADLASAAGLDYYVVMDALSGRKSRRVGSHGPSVGVISRILRALGWDGQIRWLSLEHTLIRVEQERPWEHEQPSEEEKQAKGKRGGGSSSGKKPKG